VKSGEIENEISLRMRELWNLFVDTYNKTWKKEFSIITSILNANE
jgi:hypothetical protein